MISNTNEQQYRAIEEAVRKNLADDYARNKQVADQVKDLEEICTFAISACMDHSPLLGTMLMNKAEAVFGKKLK